MAQDQNPIRPIVVGTRIYTALYNRGFGTVFAICGEQRPETVRLLGGGIGVEGGGSAVFDVVFDCGSFSRRLPECILRSLPWRVLDEVVGGNEICAAVAHATAVEEAKRRAAADAKAERAAEVARLRADPAYAHLEQDRGTGSAVVAKNIRTELKRAFPGVKFSVRKDGYDCVRVRWNDAPSEKEVEAITKRYQEGYFDGMEDMYVYAETPWTEVFGGIRFVFANQERD